MRSGLTRIFQATAFEFAQFFLPQYLPLAQVIAQ
jgi:hypothetical protein